MDDDRERKRAGLRERERERERFRELRNCLIILSDQNDKIQKSAGPFDL